MAISIQEYQDFCPTTFVYTGLSSDRQHIQYGLLAEAGEIAAALQKWNRGDYDLAERKSRTRKELGGLMYYVCMLCNIEGEKLGDILEENMMILKDRQMRNKIQGDGDNR